MFKAMNKYYEINFDKIIDFMLYLHTMQNMIYLEM